jgi:cell growth-regulating nucleolar protein
MRKLTHSIAQSAPQRNNYDPKGTAPINNGSHPNPYSQRGRGGLSRGGGRGRIPQQRVQNSWGRPRYEGTGANDTPLGTPKMSPVTRSPAPENPPVPAAAPAEPHASSPVPVVEKKIKDKSKKRKSAPVDEEAVRI